MIFDAHLDLAMNALEWNRDLTRPLFEIRSAEARLKDKPDRGRGTVCFPEMRRGGVGLCVATQIARVRHDAYSPVFGWASQAQAWAQTQEQLAWYRAMEERGELVQIRDAAALRRHVELWNDRAAGEDQTPIGYILSLEGADSLINWRTLEAAWENGLRAIGPAHYGPGIYANGTNATGGFNSRGFELLKEMSRMRVILDVTHLSDECFREAMERHEGPVWASHSNARALVPHNRQFDDAQIRTLAQRNAVIGVAMDAWMLVPNWERGRTTPEDAGLTLERWVDHLDHICQVIGNARHVGIGSDLDGAFGFEQTPADINSIADLQKIPPLLAKRGYSASDIEGILSGNFIRFLETALPAQS
jgi:membrane dipeptidase